MPISPNGNVASKGREMLGSILRLDNDRLRVGPWRIHYAWVILMLASGMWTISSSFRFAASVLVPHLQDPEGGFGWSYWEIAFAISIQWIISAFLAPILGWLGERYGMRVLLTIGAGLFVLGMVLTGYMTHLWQYYMYFGVLLGIAMTVFQVPLVSSVTTWFRTNLGAAVGGMQALQSLGTVLLVPIVALLFSEFGLSWTFWLPAIVGGVLFLVMIPPYFTDPAQARMRPYGATLNEPVAVRQEDETNKIRNRVFFAQARKTGAFWNLIGIHFWACMGHNIFIVFLVAMAEGEEVSTGTAVAIFTVMQVFSMIARFAVPILADHVGAKSMMVLCFSLQVFPCFLLLVNQDPWAFVLFSVLFGIGMGGEVPLFPIINRQYFGSAPIGSVYGWEMFGNGWGMALGPILGGLMLDHVGFKAAVLLSMGFSVVAVISAVLLPKTNKVLTPDWEEFLPESARPSEVPLTSPASPALPES